MEFVALSDSVLRALALDDPQLRFPSSQHHRSVFDPRFIPPLANSPRRSIAMPITLWLSKTHGIKRAYGPFYCKPFPTGGVKSCAYLN